MLLSLSQGTHGREPEGRLEHSVDFSSLSPSWLDELPIVKGELLWMGLQAWGGFYVSWVDTFTIHHLSLDLNVARYTRLALSSDSVISWKIIELETEVLVRESIHSDDVHVQSIYSSLIPHSSMYKRERKLKWAEVSSLAVYKQTCFHIPAVGSVAHW